MKSKLMAVVAALALGTTMTTNAMAFGHGGGGGFHGGGGGSMAARAAAISAASLMAEVLAVGTAVSLASIPAALLTDPRWRAAAGAAVASVGATAGGAAMATVPHTPGLVC